MAKRWILGLLLVFPCAAGLGKEPKPLPMPPLVSHDQAMSNYACNFVSTSQVSTIDYWNVVAFAEYGNEHKRYWSKSLGTFRGNTAITGDGAASIPSGDASNGSDVVTAVSQYGDAGKKCSEWKAAVHEMLIKSQSK
ncbi:MAG: hypothetical protein WAN10_15835 [Candidatus Acidiferrales bacterium]